MKIAIDLTPIFDHLSGVERYSINISKEIINMYPCNDYILIFKNEIHESFRNISKLNNVECVIVPQCNKLLFIQWRLLKVLRNIEADYYLFLSFTSPIFFRNNRIINAIHDLTCWDCPETLPLKMIYYYRVAFSFAIKNSWRIVTVSEFSKNRICNKYNLPVEKVLVIYDGLSDIFRDKKNNPGIKRKYQLPDRYILSLSTIEPRKNLQLLIRSYSEMILENDAIPDLVLAGRKGWNTYSIFNEIENCKERIHYTGFVEDEDLPQLYKEAELFIFPSKYEGFGLPIIEAMSQGTVVIAANASSVPEVSKNVAILFATNNRIQLKAAILEGLKLDGVEKKKRISDGIIISHKYCWNESANELYTVLNEDYKGRCI